MIVSSRDAEEGRLRRRRRRLTGALILVGGLAALAGLALLLFGRQPPALEMVRATVEPVMGGLRVITRWEVQGVAEAVRVTVAPDSAAPRMSTRIGLESADTVVFPGADSGGTLAGRSCVVPLRAGQVGEERCTPWQFVRPTASASGDSATAVRIVVQPEGLQVDPDVGGRCARWQSANPGRSPWVEINVRAVPACTGPNGKPTVAQFCAFALLPDGRRLLTENSRGNPYCEQLFAVWSVERVS